MKRPHAGVYELGNVVRAFGKTQNADSTERCFVFAWGPFLFIGPAERRAWKSSQ